MSSLSYYLFIIRVDFVTEAFVDYWWNTDKSCRRCYVCGKLMRDGYCEDMGEEMTA